MLIKVKQIRYTCVSDEKTEETVKHLSLEKQIVWITVNCWDYQEKKFNEKKLLLCKFTLCHKKKNYRQVEFVYQTHSTVCFASLNAMSMYLAFSPEFRCWRFY